MVQALKTKALLLAVGVGFAFPVAAEVKSSARIDYAEQLVMSSESARRLEQEGNDEAVAALNEARVLYQKAREIQQQGDIKEAEKIGGEALRRFTMAMKLLPKQPSVDEALRARYIEVMEELRSYMYWYDSAPYVSRDEQQTIEEVRLGLDEASKLAAVSRFMEANRILNNLLTIMVDLSNRALKSDTIISTLDFATPQEEYDYELARNSDYKRLIPIAIEQKDPAPSRLSLMQRFEKQADELRSRSDAEYAANEIEQAIASLQASTDQLIRALGIVGVR